MFKFSNSPNKTMFFSIKDETWSPYFSSIFFSMPKGIKAILDKLSLPFRISISKIEKMLFEDTKIRKINPLIIQSLLRI